MAGTWVEWEAELLEAFEADFGDRPLTLLQQDDIIADGLKRRYLGVSELPLEAPIASEDLTEPGFGWGALLCRALAERLEISPVELLAHLDSEGRFTISGEEAERMLGEIVLSGSLTLSTGELLGTLRQTAVLDRYLKDHALPLLTLDDLRAQIEQDWQRFLRDYAEFGFGPEGLEEEFVQDVLGFYRQRVAATDFVDSDPSLALLDTDDFLLVSDERIERAGLFLFRRLEQLLSKETLEEIRSGQRREPYFDLYYHRRALLRAASGRLSWSQIFDVPAEQAGEAVETAIRLADLDSRAAGTPAVAFLGRLAEFRLRALFAEQASLRREQIEALKAQAALDQLQSGLRGLPEPTEQPALSPVEQPPALLPVAAESPPELER